MYRFEEIASGIHRLYIPFETVYTSVFALTEGQHCILLDSATTDEDVLERILPALKRAGFVPEWLVCSHQHSDHCGGMPALTRAFPDAEVGLFADGIRYGNSRVTRFADGQMLLGRYQMLNLKGHCDDALAVLDCRTKTLLSCDCLQQRGVDQYGAAFPGKHYEDYKASVACIRRLGLQKIIASHDYSPYGFLAEGPDEVSQHLAECDRVADKLKSFAEAHPALTPAERSALFISAHPDWPLINRIAFET